MQLDLKFMGNGLWCESTSGNVQCQCEEAVAQFDQEDARSVPMNMGRPLQKLPALLVVGFVAAARSLGGQLFVPSRTKLSRYPLRSEPFRYGDRLAPDEGVEARLFEFVEYHACGRLVRIRA